MTKARDLANGGFGLVLIKPSTVVNGTDNGKGTVSFTATSSVSLNGVFSTTYDNYRILCRFTDTAASGSDIDLKLRLSGSDNSTASSYKYERVSLDGTTIGAARAATTSMLIGGSDDEATQNNTWYLEVFSPALATATSFQSYALSNNNNGYMRLVVGNHAVATAFDGFTFISSGNMTGKVSVYGYNN